MNIAIPIAAGVGFVAHIARGKIIAEATDATATVRKRPSPISQVARVIPRVIGAQAMRTPAVVAIPLPPFKRRKQV